MNHTERALELFRRRFYCSQAVLAAFSEECGLSEEQALRLGACFGTGMRKGEVCGACSGALMVLGMLYGQCNGKDLESRKRANAVCDKMTERFAAALGSLRCNDLLHCDASTPEGVEYAVRGRLFTDFCPIPVAAAVKLLEEILREEPPHRSFGIRENAVYRDRRGAYLIPLRADEVGVVETPKGFFFPGGGTEESETDGECVARECMEETGRRAKLGERICSAETWMRHPELGMFHPIQVYYSGTLSEPVIRPTEPDHRFRWMKRERLRGGMYLEMQNWALEQALGRDRNIAEET